MQEKIYVIIPVYNVEKYLERCINSVHNQTYKNIEVILIDDGSSDSSPLLCDKYSEIYNNISVIHQKNGGLSVARNTGIEYVLKQEDFNNSYINFVDSDDYVHPQYLEYLMRAINEARCNISCCYYSVTEKNELEISEMNFQYECMTPERLWVKNRSNGLLAWGKLYRTECFKEIRYPVGKIYEDEATTYKLLFAEEKIAYIAMPLYYYFINYASISRNINANLNVSHFL